MIELLITINVCLNQGVSWLQPNVLSKLYHKFWRIGIDNIMWQVTIDYDCTKNFISRI